MKSTADTNQGGDNDAKVSKRTITVSILGKTEESVDKWIDKVYGWYLDELRKMQDQSRYMYELAAVPAVESNVAGVPGPTGRQYRRYKLSDEKTFVSLFFPQKDTLLKILSDFENKAGKYAIAGYPRKLGLL